MESNKVITIDLVAKDLTVRLVIFDLCWSFKYRIENKSKRFAAGLHFTWIWEKKNKWKLFRPVYVTIKIVYR